MNILRATNKETGEQFELDLREIAEDLIEQLNATGMSYKYYKEIYSKSTQALIEDEEYEIHYKYFNKWVKVDREEGICKD